MDMGTTIELSTILTIAGAITAVGTAWLTIRKVNKDWAKQRNLESAKILQAAKEAVSKAIVDVETAQENIKRDLEIEIEAKGRDIQNLKENVEKDLQHIRETYNGEIRNLGQKIEDLRSELRNQHGQLVSLLTKMIDTKD